MYVKTCLRFSRYVANKDVNQKITSKSLCTFYLLIGYWVITSQEKVQNEEDSRDNVFGGDVCHGG